MKTPAITLCAALVVGAVLCLQVSEARVLDARKDVACTCTSSGLAYELLRGEKQVQDCESGYYCDCKAGKRLSCVSTWFGGWKYDEPKQVCELRFNCKNFFADQTTAAPITAAPTTAAPTTAAPTKPPTTKAPTTTEEPTTLPPTTTTPAMPKSCDCGARTTGNQLIRGEQQVALCESGYYCDCANKQAKQCEVVWGRAWRYDEFFQTCVWIFDCKKYDYSTTTPQPTTTTTTTTAAPTTAKPTAAPTTAKPTAAPTTAKPTAAPTTAKPTAAPTTAAPTPAPFCLSTAKYELIRGDDEVSQCKHGYYKDCQNQKVDHCFNLWGFGWMFNEQKQECQFMQDCKKFFDL